MLLTLQPTHKTQSSVRTIFDLFIWQRLPVRVPLQIVQNAIDAAFRDNSLRRESMKRLSLSDSKLGKNNDPCFLPIQQLGDPMHNVCYGIPFLGLDAAFCKVQMYGMQSVEI
jgi:hypothetical protein